MQGGHEDRPYYGRGIQVMEPFSWKASRIQEEKCSNSRENRFDCSYTRPW